MPLFRRPDGVLATDVPPFRQIMPFIMRSRNESAVYFNQRLDLRKTLPFIETWNQTHARRITLFHVLLFAMVRTLEKNPRLNRFVAGSRIYQRDGIWISYSAKKKLERDAPIVVIKRRFEPDQGFVGMLEQVYQDVDEGRSDRQNHVDKELRLILALPAFVVRALVRLLFALDGWNLVPDAFIRPDPLYASVFLANLGSLKLPAAYHHLYEYGNIPLFGAIGRVEDSSCEVKWSFDERVEDGLYCAGAMEIMRAMVEDPETHLK